MPPSFGCPFGLDQHILILTAPAAGHENVKAVKPVKAGKAGRKRETFGGKFAGRPDEMSMDQYL